MCGLWDVPRNRIAVNMFIMMIFAYSAMKKRANGPAAYVEALALPSVELC